MTISAALKSISNYPIPSLVIENIADEAGLGEVTQTVTKEMRKGSDFKRATAYVYRFLADAPNIQQGGISYTFSEDERSRFAKRAAAILDELGEGDQADIPCGYIGEDF